MNEDSKNQIDPFSPKASLGIPYHENEYFQKQIYPKFLKFLDFNTDQAHTLMYDGISAKRYRHSTLGFSEEVQKRFWKPKREYRNIPGCVALPALGLKVAGISIEQDFCIPAEGKSSLPMIQKIQVLNEFLKKEPIFSEVNIYNRNSFHLFYALDENQIGKNLKEFELLLESEKFSNFRVRTRRRPMFIPLCPNGFRPVIFENASFRVIKDDQIPYFIHSLMNWGY